MARPVSGPEPGATVPTVDVVTLGETLALFRSTGVGPLAHNTDFTLSVGGAESNVAIAVTRLGGTAAWCGRVGDDAFGELILRELRAEGVRVHAVVDAAAPTAHMVRIARTPVLAQVTYARTGSAGSRISRTDVPQEVLRAARILHVTGITAALSTTALDAVVGTIADARAHGVTVSFDVNHRAALWDAATARAVYRRLLPEIDIVFAGADEAQLVLDQDAEPEQLARRLADLGPQQAVVKLGAEGCLAVIDGERHAAPGIAIEPVDTVGAGDAFVGGYLAELAAGREPAERLATANAAGAFACLSPGDWEGLPRRSELGLLSATEPVIR